MKSERILNAMGEIDTELIEDAISEKNKSKKPDRIKWVAIAACLCLGLAGVWGLLTGPVNTVNLVKLIDGETVKFYKTDFSSASIDLDCETRNISAEETAAVFGTMPVSEATVYYSADDNTVLGVSAMYEDMRLLISMPEIQLNDTVIGGEEKTSTVKNTPVVAGYFKTDANSQGVRTVIYYASIRLEKCNVYIENAGEESESDSLKEAVASAIEEFVSTEFDLSELQN